MAEKNDFKKSIVVNMKIFVADDYAKMSKQAAEDGHGIERRM